MNQETGDPRKIKVYASVLANQQSHGLGPVDVLEVKKIEKRELKEEVFAPPTGYKKIIPR
jgi:hypothetical protein